MQNNTRKLIARLLLIPITRFFAYPLFTHFVNFINDLFYALTKDNYELFLRFDTCETVIFWITVTWIATHISFEVIAHLSKNFRYKRLLTNLRYAPIAIIIISGFVVVAFDAGMIAYSKEQIRNYIFSDSQMIAEPDIQLHNDYRHWCGNGFSGRENYLYFDTASEGIDNTNPYVRTRSLLMMEEVEDWINGGDDRYDNHLANSCRDSDAVVRNVAEDLLNKSNSRCEKVLQKR